MGIMIGIGQTRPQFAYDYYYGIEWDSTISNPDCMRVGKMELHSELPLQNQMRRCLLDDEGNVLNYLSPTDSTKLDTGGNADLTGAHGQVMVELPEMYVRFETDGTKSRCLMSAYPLPGFKKWGKDYVSAYEAALQRSTLKLSSVVNTDADYRGGNNNAERDNTHRDMRGMPAVSLSLTTFRTYANNRGNGWKCNTYHIHKKLWWLFAVEYATLNTQKDFNPALTTEGYHQGGLGSGVTNINYDKWNTFNGVFPFIPCGYTNSLGNNTGVIDYTMPPEYDETPFVVHVPSYRGVENPFGHIWKLTDGVLVNVQAEDAGGRSMMYVCRDSEKYASTLTEDYIYFADAPREVGCITKIALGEDGEIMPLAVGGSTTTYFCDYYYSNIPESGSSLRCVLFGAAAYYGAYAGFLSSFTLNAPSSSSSSVGSRLCFEPANRNE